MSEILQVAAGVYGPLIVLGAALAVAFCVGFVRRPAPAPAPVADEVVICALPFLSWSMRRWAREVNAAVAKGYEIMTFTVEPHPLRTTCIARLKRKTA